MRPLVRMSTAVLDPVCPAVPPVMWPGGTCHREFWDLVACLEDHSDAPMVCNRHYLAFLACVCR